MKVAQELNEMLNRARKVAELIQSVNPLEGAQRWVTLKKTWEAVAINSIRLLTEYTNLSQINKCMCSSFKIILKLRNLTVSF